MDAEDLGRKLLLTPLPAAGTHRMLSLQALSGSSHKEGLPGPRRGFGCPPAVCPPERPRPFTHYRYVFRGWGVRSRKFHQNFTPKTAWWTFLPRKEYLAPPLSPRHSPSAGVHHPASPRRKPPLYFQIKGPPPSPRTLPPFPRPRNRKENKKYPKRPPRQ